MNTVTNKFIVLFALLWYSATAFFSIGYFHPDEHYQIIEFSQVIDREIDVASLPWEFRDKIRPSVQPTLCNLIFKACDTIYIDSHYTKTFVLRLLTGIFAVFVISFFFEASKNLVKEQYRTWYLIISYFLWFLPFLNVRFSSETWAGLFLLLSVSLVLQRRTSLISFLLIGIILGLVFEFRFQAGIASAGLILWLIWVQKEHLKHILMIGIGGLMAIMACTLLDFWFYDAWVFTPLQYMMAFANEAAKFDESPWFEYFKYILGYSFWPFGVLILASYLVLIFRNPKSLFIWISLPFLLVHSCIGHKELRFLFPLINFIPIVCFLAFQEAKEFKPNKSFTSILKVSGYLLLFINGIAIVVASLKPADIGRMSITKQIFDLKPTKPINLIAFEGSNPFDPYNFLVANFYMVQDISFRNLNQLNDLDSTWIDNEKQTFLVLKTKDAIKDETQKLLNHLRFKKLGQSVPEPFMPLLKLYGHFPEKEVLIVYGIE